MKCTLPLHIILVFRKVSLLSIIRSVALSLPKHVSLLLKDKHLVKVYQLALKMVLRIGNVIFTTGYRLLMLTMLLPDYFLCAGESRRHGGLLTKRFVDCHHWFSGLRSKPNQKDSIICQFSVHVLLLRPMTTVCFE